MSEPRCIFSSSCLGQTPQIPGPAPESPPCAPKPSRGSAGAWGTSQRGQHENKGGTRPQVHGGRLPGVWGQRRPRPAGAGNPAEGRVGAGSFLSASISMATRGTRDPGLKYALPPVLASGWGRETERGVRAVRGGSAERLSPEGARGRRFRACGIPGGAAVPLRIPECHWQVTTTPRGDLWTEEVTGSRFGFFLGAAQRQHHPGTGWERSRLFRSPT